MPGVKIDWEAKILDYHRLSKFRALTEQEIDDLIVWIAKSKKQKCDERYRKNHPDKVLNFRNNYRDKHPERVRASHVKAVQTYRTKHRVRHLSQMRKNASRKPTQQQRERRVEISCVGCGEPFWVFPATAARGGNKKPKFCSASCKYAHPTEVQFSGTCKNPACAKEFTVPTRGLGGGPRYCCSECQRVALCARRRQARLDKKAAAANGSSPP